MTGSISIGEELSSIQLLVKEWFFACYAAGTVLFFCTQGVTYLVFMALSQRRNRPGEDEPSLDLGSDLGSDVASQAGTHEEQLDA